MVRMFEKILWKNDCMSDGRYMSAAGIMVHSTGANNKNINRYVPVGTVYSSNHWNKPGIDKCVHGFLGVWPDGDIAFCQTMPWLKRGWHAGVAHPKGWSANNSYIGFEICEDDLTDEHYFNQVFEAAEDVCAFLCKKFSLDPEADGTIISHHEGFERGIACNHADCDHWLRKFGKDMDWFRKGVIDKMERGGRGMDQMEYDIRMEQYLIERYKRPPSDWAISEGVPAWAVSMGLTVDQSGMDALITKQETLAFIKRFKTRLDAEWNQRRASLISEVNGMINSAISGLKMIGGYYGKG